MPLEPWGGEGWQEFTFALWLAPANLGSFDHQGGRRGIMGPEDFGFPTLAHGGPVGALRYYYRDASSAIISGAVEGWFAPDTYVHTIWTRRAGYDMFYKNGELMLSTAAAATLPFGDWSDWSGSSDIWIGRGARCNPFQLSSLCDADHSQGFFRGAIDDFTVRRGRYCHSALPCAVIHGDSPYNTQSGMKGNDSTAFVYFKIFAYGLADDEVRQLFRPEWIGSPCRSACRPTRPVRGPYWTAC
jgi:hypothetical protein